MSRVVRRNSIAQRPPEKVKFNFDVNMLNSLIRYTQCDAALPGDLNNMMKLFDYTSGDVYQKEPELYARVCTLQSILKSMVVKRLKDPEMIRNELMIDFEPGVDIIDNLRFAERNRLNLSECQYVRNYVIERLQYIEVYQRRDKILTLLRDIDYRPDYTISYTEKIHELKSIIGELMVSLQEKDNNEGLLKEFAFSDKESSEILMGMIKKVKQPNAMLQTGIRQLNAILSGGFQPGRLYTILGGSGKFKSGTLLNIADMIRRYNPQVIGTEGGMRKCVLFITLENSIEETIERLYDMYSPIDDDIRTASPEQVLRVLQEDCGLGVNGDNPNGIDMCFRYAGNLEITTADIYGIIGELNNEGYLPIAIVLDYIKRIDSAHDSRGDERVRMSYVAKELKSIAQYYQVPVITAMQLNRDGNNIIDSALRDSKQDVARFVGSASIGNAWDIVEDSDWVCLVNPEMQKSTNQVFLTFNRLKIRGKKIATAAPYFNHPFSNAKNIRLEPDIDRPSSISLSSLNNDLEELNTGEDNINYQNIEQKNRIKTDSSSIMKKLNERKGRILTGVKSPSQLID